MLGYLRIFFVIILLTAVGGTVAGGWFVREQALEDLTKLVEKTNAGLGHGYVAAVWKRYRETIIPLLATPEQLKDNADVKLFAQDTVRYFQNTAPVRINVYDAKGKLILTDPLNAGKQPASGTGSLDNGFMMRGMMGFDNSSQLLNDVGLQNQRQAKMVQTIIPLKEKNIVTPNPLADGAVEILFDVTEQADELTYFGMLAVGMIVGIFIVFLAILMMSSKRAQAILAKQIDANHELTEAAKTAEAENQEKSQFLANISHELRTPLNAIIGFSDIIKKEMMPQIEDKKYHDYVNDIYTSGVHLLSLINDILDYSKAEAGKLALEVSEVNASKMIQNSMRLVSPRAESANVKLIEQLPGEPIIMVTDGKKFKQVLLNLLSNAVKFTPSGGQVTVTAWQNLADDTYSFEVEDTGIGIAPKDISRAMSPFGQVDNTLKRKYEGTGLGLPLTKKFVELMGGKFKIESELDKGTKITFTMPREMIGADGVAVKAAS